MDDHTATSALTGLAAARVALGGSLALAPGLIGRLWVGAAAGDGPTATALRSAGARDALLGAGLLVGLRQGAAPARRWAQACAAADAADLVATLAARRRLPARSVAAVSLFAAAGAAAGAWLAVRV